MVSSLTISLEGTLPVIMSLLSPVLIMSLECILSNILNLEYHFCVFNQHISKLTFLIKKFVLERLPFVKTILPD